MKKNLLALAVAGAFVAPAAMADNSNVNVYGIAHVAVDFTKNGDIVGTSGVNTHKISSNQSRIGFKGSEDLGGGLKAIFQVERSVEIDAGSLSTARNTFAGVAGDAWGSLTLGINDTPYKSATRGLDVFADQFADNRNLMGGVAVKNATAGFDQRFNNTARYDSPDMSGFKAGVSYSAGAENNTNSALNVKGKAWSLGGTYATGPFFGTLAYQKNTFGSTSSITNFPALGAACAAQLCDEKAWKLGAGYKVDQFAVNGVYEKTSDNLGNAAGGMGHKAYYLAGTFNATANDAIKLAYTKAGKLQDGNAADTGAKQWSIGVDHNLSKRTAVYALYTKLDNDAAASYNLGTVSTGAVTAQGAGADPSAFSLGLRHSF